MSRRSPFIAIALLLCFTSPASARQDVGTLITKMQEKYGGLKGASAPYTREVISRSMVMMGGKVSGDLASGRLFFQAPHFMRMDQEEPTHETLVTDGHTLWWYLPDKKTAYKYPAEKFGKELNLLGDLFQGLKGVEKRFQITLLEPGKANTFRLKLTPTPAWEQVDHLVLGLSRSFDIQLLEIHNLLGSVTRFTIKDLKPAGPFKQGFFKLQVPEDVKVIEED
ncbi:MAG: outer membrane lipoprotein carrier protein LolA [Desulfatiglandaceae bacterium]|jgi:outer membrane lipoprotein-sorting protein